MRSEKETSLDKDLESLLEHPFFSDIKIKGNDGEEISAHRNILTVRSEVFKRMLLNGMRETTQDIIEFPEFSSDTLHIILEYLYTGKVTEKILTIDTVAESFHCADFFLIEQLKLQIIEFFKNHLKNNTENKINLSAKVLSRLLECMESTINNEFVDLLAYVTNYPNKIPVMEETLKGIGDEVKSEYLKKLLSTGMFYIIVEVYLTSLVLHYFIFCLFCHNNEYLPILVLFLSCFLLSNPPKKHIHIIIEQPDAGK
jgi:hypothetical protein